MYTIKLTEYELGFEPKCEYYMAINDEYSQPVFYIRNNDRKLKTKSQTLTRGYITVAILDTHNTSHNVKVHRIVANAFILNDNDKPHIDHIDTVRHNNCINNLRWVTPKENSNNELTRQHLHDSWTDERKSNQAYVCKMNYLRRKLKKESDGKEHFLWSLGK